MAHVIEKPGTIVADRYEISSLLGEGASSAVYVAIRLDDQLPVALKIISPDEDESTNLVLSRLLRGARLTQRIEHEHVIRTIDFGRWGPRGQSCFVAMELVHGIPLTFLMDVFEGYGQCVDLVCQVLEGLVHVHSRGIVHRDIKPDNILIQRDSDGNALVRIADFGIATAKTIGLNLKPVEDLSAASIRSFLKEMTRAGDDPSEKITLQRSFVGTPAYMAPEQSRSFGGEGPSVDQYAVGSILYRMLSGKLPFEGTVLEIVEAKRSRDVPRVVGREGMDLPENLVDVLMRCMSMRPLDRYPMTADILSALGPFRETANIDENRWSLFYQRYGVQPGGSASATEQTVTTQGFLRAVEEQKGLIERRLYQEFSGAATLPFVGRGVLLQRLSSVSRQVLDEGDGRVVFLSGEPGIGKSALAKEFAAMVSERGSHYVMHCWLHEGRSAADAFRATMDRVLATHGLPPDEMKAGLNAALDKWGWGNERRAEAFRILQFLRPDIFPLPESLPPAERQHRDVAAVSTFFRFLCGRKPTILVVDDLDAGGVFAASLMEQILFEMRLEPFPFLLLATVTETRGDIAPLLQRTMAYEGSHRERIVIEGIHEEVMMNALQTHLHFDLDTAKQITTRSNGNPLYTSYLAHLEISRSFGQQRPKESEKDGKRKRRFTSFLQDLLQAFVQEKMAHFDDPAALEPILLDAAILGPTFKRRDLEEMVRFDAERDSSNLEVLVEELIDAGILEQADESQVVDGSEQEQPLFFPQRVVRELLLDGASETALRGARERAQRMAVIRCEGEGDESYAGMVGELLSDLNRTEEAIDWWKRGYIWSIGAGDTEQALALGRSSYWGMSPGDIRRPEFGVSLGRNLMDAGLMEQAAEVLRDVIEMGVEVDAALCAGDVLSDLYENSGEGDKWRELIEEMSLLESGAGRRGRHALYCARTMWRNNHDQRSLAIEDAKKAMREADSDAEAQRAAQRFVYCCLPTGDVVKAEQAAIEAVSHAGDRLDLRVRSLRCLGFVYTWSGRGAQAIEVQEEVLSLCRKGGLRARIPVAFHDLGEACRMEMDIEQAEKHYGDAIRLAEALELEASVLLGGYKLVICDLLRHRTFNNTVSRLEDMWQVSADVGLWLSKSYSTLLIAWAHAIDGRKEAAQEALAESHSAIDVFYDPQWGLILEEIADGILGDDAPSSIAPDRLGLIVDALKGAVKAWSFVGNSERVAGCQSKLEALELSNP